VDPAGEFANILGSALERLLEASKDLDRSLCCTFYLRRFRGRLKFPVELPVLFGYSIYLRN